MEILTYKIWFLIRCSCGNELNLTEHLEENHCEKCGKTYQFKSEKSIEEKVAD